MAGFYIASAVLVALALLLLLAPLLRRPPAAVMHATAGQFCWDWACRWPRRACIGWWARRRRS